jgi:hypothetical protein
VFLHVQIEKLNFEFLIVFERFWFSSTICVWGRLPVESFLEWFQDCRKTRSDPKELFHLAVAIIALMKSEVRYIFHQPTLQYKLYFHIWWETLHATKMHLFLSIMFYLLHMSAMTVRIKAFFLKSNYINQDCSQYSI